ncbi:Dihydroxyacetone kinase 2, partial [Spiromyces aspiralis]
SAYQHVVDKEPTVTRLDEEMGDGDCGKVLLAGATAVRDALKSGSLYLGDDLGMTLHQIAGLVEDAMGGTSGVIYCIFLDALAQGVGSAVAETAGNSSTEDGTGRAIADSAVEIWSSALPKALDTLYKYTTARPGHRTLIDALAPFVETFVETKGDVARAVQMADQGAKATTHMKPKRGRAVYTGSTKQIEDAGAAGLCAVLHGILEGLKSN